MSESIMVIPSAAFRLLGVPARFLPEADFDSDSKESVTMHILRTGMGVSYRDRDTVEPDEDFRQVITYPVVVGNISGEDRVLHYRRAEAASEKRLTGKRSIGFGGHVREVPGQRASRTLFDSLYRELTEEIGVTEKDMEHEKFLGSLMTNEDHVSRCHVGIIWQIRLKGTTVIRPEDHLEDVRWSTISDLYKKELNDFGPWSQMLIEYFYHAGGVIPAPVEDDPEMESEDGLES